MLNPTSLFQLRETFETLFRDYLQQYHSTGLIFLAVASDQIRLESSRIISLLRRLEWFPAGHENIWLI